MTDLSANISPVVSTDMNIDFSEPSITASLSDGMVADIDTTYDGTQLDAHWAACTDDNSGVASYVFAVGTTPGAADVVPWTNTGLTMASATGLSLVNMQMYYFSVQAVNGAQMRSPVVISDGQVYLSQATGIRHTAGNSPDMLLYPNPTKGIFTVSAGQSMDKNARVIIVNLLGEVVFTHAFENKMQIDLSEQPNGLYYVMIRGQSAEYFQKIIVTK